MEKFGVDVTFINGGTVVASGSMLDRIEDGGQNYVVFSFSERQHGKTEIQLKNSQGKVVIDEFLENAFS